MGEVAVAVTPIAKANYAENLSKQIGSLIKVIHKSLVSLSEVELASRIPVGPVLALHPFDRVPRQVKGRRTMMHTATRFIARIRLVQV